ncbi:hypothetical protein CPB85DRAFT_77279 [Mucidula mucida]|nr:hypothetical protein CPB85DRAFT_77279 [Mucidula mucida]
MDRGEVIMSCLPSVVSQCVPKSERCVRRRDLSSKSYRQRVMSWTSFLRLKQIERESQRRTGVVRVEGGVHVRAENAIAPSSDRSLNEVIAVFRDCFSSSNRPWPHRPRLPRLHKRLPKLGSLAQHPNLTPQAVDAAKALQDNVMMKKYKLSNKMLKPASVPHHYERLMEGMEKSAKGIGRPWWKRFFGIW